MGYYLTVLLVIFFDQLSKLWVIRHLKIGETKEVLSHFLYLTLLYNKGTAFGIVKEVSLAIVLFSTLLVVGFLIYSKLNKKETLIFMLGLSFICGGALGNLVDRIRWGYVIDFVDIKIWPVFNLADSFITIGVGLIIVDMILRRKGQENA